MDLLGLSGSLHLCLSSEGRCEAYPVGVQLVLLMFYFGLRNELYKKSHPSSVILPEFFPLDVIFDGLDGRTDGYQKYPLIFFMLRYIKRNTHIYLHIYQKNVLTIILWD